MEAMLGRGYLTRSTAIAGAIMLLIPRLANLGAITLAIAMAGATYTHLVQGEPGASIPFLLLVGVLVVLWLRNPGVLRRSTNAAP